MEDQLCYVGSYDTLEKDRLTRSELFDAIIRAMDVRMDSAGDERIRIFSAWTCRQVL